MEADIRPFRGLLLGLFFVTTGASLDVGLLLREWEIVVALLVGLIAVKILIIGSIAPFFGLNRCRAVVRSAASRVMVLAAVHWGELVFHGLSTYLHTGCGTENRRLTWLISYAVAVLCHCDRFSIILGAVISRR